VGEGRDSSGFDGGEFLWNDYAVEALVLPAGQVDDGERTSLQFHRSSLGQLTPREYLTRSAGKDKEAAFFQL